MASGRSATDKLGEETNEKADLNLLYISCAAFMRLVTRDNIENQQVVPLPHPSEVFSHCAPVWDIVASCD
jgi:hypothetical protein